ncbi:Ig-like domain-containing protein [Xenorhabdus miraniensis]|uniref:Big-1 domain-containing protein n=1 Tax=Xenorhabdus miraniensis TaxID=351674 RepID=A0A2D0JJA6_9GAMM|nr:Ig-like domain-containing protein [Xenorhabdus miraniensis]PHM45549.1 hypothetical protein Xmir_04288 [Xenorhabdus miraniensis]
MSIKNTILNAVLVPPALPQSYNGIIDESKLDQDELVIIIKKHEKIRLGYKIIVHLTPYLSSIPFFITDENIENPTYQVTIPFSAIPLGSYDIYYTITDLVWNKAKSESTHVTIKKSASPLPAVIAYLESEILANGMPSNDYTPNSVLITALDEKTKPISGAPIRVVSHDDVCITPSSGVTNQDGQIVFCATSDADGIFSIQVASGDIKDKVELYFAPVNEARLIITGSQQIGEEYETITIQVYDKNTIDPIKNSIVYYKIDQAINISNILEIALNPDTIRSMITDEIGQFKINLKGKVGGNCIIRVTANNYIGSIKYTMGQQ